MDILEIQCMFDSLVESLRRDGKSFEWIEETLKDCVFEAIESVEDSKK